MHCLNYHFLNWFTSSLLFEEITFLFVSFGFTDYNSLKTLNLKVSLPPFSLFVEYVD